MARESIRGAGRDASGPHGYTFRIEQYLRAKGDEGATLDELTDVAMDQRWISRNFAHVRYSNHLNTTHRYEDRKRDLSQEPGSLAKINEPRWSPERIMLEGKTRIAVRFCIYRSLNGGKGRWCYASGETWLATGRGIKQKPQGGFTEDQIHATPEQISRDVIERELIRALKPHMHQKTHKLTPGEWELLSKWVQLSVVGWQP